MNGRGTAEVLTADTPKKERGEILAALRYKRITHLISVDVLGEGIDIPSVPIIASMRPTQSTVVAMQQWGRGSRPKNNTDGGEYILIDYVNNTKRHGSTRCSS